MNLINLIPPLLLEVCRNLHVSRRRRVSKGLVVVEPSHRSWWFVELTSCTAGRVALLAGVKLADRAVVDEVLGAPVFLQPDESLGASAITATAGRHDTTHKSGVDGGAC